MRASELGWVVEYIEGQEAHGRSLSFQEEYRRFLKQYEVECEERHVWG